MPRQDAQAGLEHIAYETGMTVASALRLTRGRLHDSVLENACLESMLLHARSLSDLLTTTGSRRFKTDMHLSDFSDPAWDPRPGESVDYLQAQGPMINRHLAHLTWDRTDVPDSPGWTPRELVGHLVVVAQAWTDDLEQLNPSLLTGDLRKYLHAARTQLGLD